MKMIPRLVHSQLINDLRDQVALSSNLPIRTAWSTEMAELFIVQGQIQIFTTGIKITTLNTSIMVQ